MSAGALQLYPRRQVDVVALAQERIRIVIGGPHMGTTTMLAAIQERMRLRTAVSARRDPDLARNTIADWSDGRVASICVDNIDAIIGELQVQKHLIKAQRGHAVLGGFFSIDRARAQYRAEAARAHDTGEPDVLSPTDLWWQKSYVIHLNPWGYPSPTQPRWSERQATVVAAQLTADLAQVRRDGAAPGLVGDTDDVAAEAAAILVRVTGGHPMLIGRGYQTLFSWIAGGGTSALNDLEELLAAALNSVAFDTFTTAGRAVQREIPDGFAELLKLADAPDARPQGLPHADLLRASGLVREVDDRGIAVWELVHPRVGPALRYVADAAAERGAAAADRARPGEGAPVRRVRIRPDPRQPKLSGWIERADDASIVLTLSDTQWSLLWHLAEARGEAVTVSRLAKKTRKQRTAVNPGLQRLRDKLRKAGLQTLVYNCGGSGYAIDMNALAVD